MSTSPNMMPSSPKQFDTPTIEISPGPELQASPKQSLFSRVFKRGSGENGTIATNLTKTSTTSSSGTTSSNDEMNYFSPSHGQTFPQTASGSATPRLGRGRDRLDAPPAPRRFLSVNGTQGERSQSRSRSRSRSRTRSRSPAPRVASINHVGRHANDWLFGGLSLTGRNRD